MHFPGHATSGVLEGLWVESICGSSIKAPRGRKCLLASPHARMLFPAALEDLLFPASFLNLQALE